MALPVSYPLSHEAVDELMLDIQHAVNSWQRREGTECPCGESAIYRCNSCPPLPGSSDLCCSCLLAAHATLPFHKILEWIDEGPYFTRITLRDLGLRVAFGHGGAPCPARLEAITTTGLQTVTVDFCTCPGAFTDGDQIKAHGWWPFHNHFVSALPLAFLESFPPLLSDSESESEGSLDGRISEAESSEGGISGAGTDVGGAVSDGGASART
ncbi:hypothetical protein C8R43DRAFT_1120879 [Mycena crocata]|nr:hypothetical protein C8R43DRAFT_1120879 [Mycena crocata]